MKPVLATGQALVALGDKTWQTWPFALTEDDLEQSNLFVSFEGEDSIYDHQVEDAARIKLEGELTARHLDWTAVALLSYALHLDTTLIHVTADVDFGGYSKRFQLELCYADFQDRDSFCESHELTEQLIEDVANERLFETYLPDQEPSAVAVQLHFTTQNLAASDREAKKVA